MVDDFLPRRRRCCVGCTVFNTTITRGPRNVARCTSCACSRGGGVEACDAVACKIPHKFSDKCRPVYRGDDCCPVDYDCTGVGGKPDKPDRKSEASGGGFTVKPSGRHHKWDNSLEARSAGGGQGRLLGLINRDDILPYGQNDFSVAEQQPKSALGRSDEAVVTGVEDVTRRPAPPGVSVPRPPVGGMVIPSKRLRGSLPPPALSPKTSGNLEQIDAAWRVVNISQPLTGTDALLITAQDGLLLDPKVTFVGLMKYRVGTNKLSIDWLIDWFFHFST